MTVGITSLGGRWPNGAAQINLGQVDLPGAFINVMKVNQGINYSTASPSNFDIDGYPITTLAANVGGSILLPSSFAGNGTEWTVKWTGTKIIQFVINAPLTKAVVTNATTSGGSNSVMTVTTLGSPGSITFNFNNYSSTSLSFYFPSGFANVAGTGELILARSSDLASYSAGGIYTPEFLAVLRGMNPKIIRAMGWAQVNGSNEINWNYRTAMTSLSWMNPNFPPNVWGGNAATADNIAYTCGNATDSNAGAYVDGEVIQLKWPAAGNANTSPTLNRNSLGAKSILNLSGTALAAVEIAANSFNTFVYDGVLGKFLQRSGGVFAGVPIEAQVTLANTIRAHLWTCIPHLANDTYVTNWATYIRDNLNPILTFYAEYTNEMWNFNGPHSVQTQWAYQRGLAFGWPNANNEPFHGWYGLRSRQMMGTITTLWGARANLKRVLAFQARGTTAEINTYRLKGFDLNSTSFPIYGTYTSGVNYDTAPNRPIDYADVLSYATYYQGAYFNDSFNYTGPNSTLPAAGIAAMTSMATNYTSGSVATALAALDTDIRSGTNSAVSTPQTLADFNTNVYPAWETIAATFTGKTVEPYEGGLQAVPPTTAQCTTLGITDGISAASASAALTSLLAAYKNGIYGFAIVGDQFNQFLGQAHSRNPSWLTITGPNAWSLLPGDVFSTPYQTYYAFQAFR